MRMLEATRGQLSHHDSLLESASPLRGLDDNIVGAVVVLQDLTQHRQVEAEFEQRIARLVSVGVELEGAAKLAGRSGRGGTGTVP